MNTFSIFAFTTLCFFYFKKYFKNSTSIIGVLLIGILINVHLKDLFIVATILDASFLVLALLLIKNQKYYWLLPLLVFAGLNRETSILIIVIFFIKLIFLKEIKKKNILLFFYLILTYIFIFISLRYFLGPAEHMSLSSEDHFLLAIFLWNIKLEYFLYALFLYFIFFGFLWIYVISGFKKLNYELRENYLILLFYLPLIWVFGSWYETRLLIPMFSIVIPSLLAFYDNTK